MQNRWFGQLIETNTDGTAVNTSTSETTILPAYAKWILEAGYFNRPGDELLLEASGRLSCIVTTPGTLTIRLKFGSVAVFDSGAINLNVVAKTTVPWQLRATLTARAVGSGTTATLFTIGRLQSEALVGAPLPTAGGNTCLLVPVGTPAVGTGFDSTSAQIVDLTAQFSVSNAGNGITCHQFRLISPN